MLFPVIHPSILYLDRRKSQCHAHATLQYKSKVPGPETLEVRVVMMPDSAKPSIFMATIDELLQHIKRAISQTTIVWDVDLIELALCPEQYTAGISPSDWYRRTSFGDSYHCPLEFVLCWWSA